METHSHEIHKAPGHGWKHYLFEFFMLFIAVSLGFYAENLPEEIKKKEEIKTNMVTILVDLKSDVTRLESVFERNEYSCKMACSLIILFTRENQIPVKFIIVPGLRTGLGLSLSYGIIKAHGGEIKAKTKEGEGSEFIVQWPIV